MSVTRRLAKPVNATTVQYIARLAILTNLVMYALVLASAGTMARNTQDANTTSQLKEDKNDNLA